MGHGLLSLESRDSITFVCIGDTPRNTKEKTIMTLRSASGRFRRTPECAHVSAVGVVRCP